MNTSEVLNINDKEAIKHWAQKFNCTPKMLRLAIKNSNGSVDEIRKMVSSKFARRTSTDKKKAS